MCSTDVKLGEGRSLIIQSELGMSVIINNSHYI